MADILQSTEQHYAIKCMHKEGETFTNAYTRLRWTTLESLRGNHYGSVDDVKRGVQTWIKQTPVAFFEKGIMDLVPRWQKCIASDGDYIEK